MKLIFTFLLIVTSTCFSQYHWERILDLPVNGIEITNNGDILVGSHLDGPDYGIWIYRTKPDEMNWELLNEEVFEIGGGFLYLNQLINFVTNDSGDIFAKIWGNGVFHSKNNGDNWEKLTNGHPEEFYGNLGIYIDLNGYIYSGVGGGGFSPGIIFKSTNNGENWSNLNRENIKCFTLLHNEDIFAGTPYHGAYLSTDNGDSWTYIDTEMEFHENNITTNSNGDIFYYYGPFVFRSSDYGLNWEKVLGDSSNNIGFTTIEINHDGYIFAGSSRNGLFYSIDNGNSWDKDDGFPEVFVNCIYINNYNGDVYVGTDYGLYLCANRIVSIKNNKIIPTQYTLYQNYPNPFNPATTIKYSIPVKSWQSSVNSSQNQSFNQPINKSNVNGFNVALIVYDMLGKEIATLVNTQKRSGNYEVKWDASGQASGVYFYKLTAGTFSETKKMVLLR